MNHLQKHIVFYLMLLAGLLGGFVSQFEASVSAHTIAVVKYLIFACGFTAAYLSKPDSADETNPPAAPPHSTP